MIYRNARLSNGTMIETSVYNTEPVYGSIVYAAENSLEII